MDYGELERGSTSLFCAVEANLSSQSNHCKKKGEKDIPRPTDTTVSQQLQSKKESRILKLLNLSKENDVCQ